MNRVVVSAVALASGFVVMAAADDPKLPIPLKAPPQKDAKKDVKGVAKAKAEAKPDPKATDRAEADALATILRDLLHKHFPDPLSKTSQNWGHQKAVTVVKRHREGLRFWSEAVQEMQNDGVWRRIAVRVPDSSKVVLAVLELTHPEENKILATIGLQVERVEVHFEQQVWRTGLRLYGGETRGHCKGSLLVKVEVTTKTELKKGAFLPDVLLKIRATEAQLGYSDLVIDHTAGLDGDAAKALGDLAVKTIKTLKPDLERDLLEKGNAAIVKAAGMREVKASLDMLLKLKK